MHPTECSICKLPKLNVTSLSHHECPFYERAFHRVDSAKRHAKTCSSRGNRPLSQNLKRGRRSHACDQCSRMKVSCNATSPCKRCTSRNVSCTYDRFCVNPSHNNVSINKGQLHVSTIRPPLEFPLSCADPSGGFIDEVVVKRDQAFEPLQYGVRSIPLDMIYDTETIDPRLLCLNSMFSPFGADLDSFDLDSQSSDLQSSQDSFGVTDVDLSVCVEKLKLEVNLSLEDQVHLEHLMHKIDSLNFWTASNFRKYMTEFFQKTQLLATLVQKPMFRPDKVSKALLFVIAITGHSYVQTLQGSSDIYSLLALREVGEHFICSQLEHLLNLPTSATSSHAILEALQALYIIITLQFCVKNTRVRRRVITKHHSTLIDTLRTFGMTRMEHDSMCANEDWRGFVYRESCIRLVYWTFMNDSWFTLFTNRPPAMTLSDMSGDLPCNDSLWKAETPRVFQALSCGQNSYTNCLRLLPAIELLLANDFSSRSLDYFKTLDVEHFLVVIFAFHYIIFHNRLSVVIKSNSLELLRGLDRLDLMWKDAQERTSQDKQRLLGMARNCEEIIFLLKRIVEIAGTERGENLEYLRRNVTYDTTAFFSFIKRCIQAV